jgi:hypothetical protein
MREYSKQTVFFETLLIIFQFDDVRLLFKKKLKSPVYLSDFFRINFIVIKSLCFSSLVWIWSRNHPMSVFSLNSRVSHSGNCFDQERSASSAFRKRLFSLELFFAGHRFEVHEEEGQSLTGYLARLVTFVISSDIEHTFGNNHEGIIVREHRHQG